MPSPTGHLDDAPDGTLTLWSGPPLPPELAETHARLNQRAWLIALPLSVLLALLAYDAFALDLACSRELHGCTSRHLFNDELHPLHTLGMATVEQRDVGRTRNRQQRPYYVVLVPGLSARSGPSGDAVFTSSDQAEARFVAQAFNAFRAGRAPGFSSLLNGFAVTVATFAFVGTLLVTALLVGMLKGPMAARPPFTCGSRRTTSRCSPCPPQGPPCSARRDATPSTGCGCGGRSTSSGRSRSAPLPGAAPSPSRPSRPTTAPTACSRASRSNSRRSRTPSTSASSTCASTGCTADRPTHAPRAVSTAATSACALSSVSRYSACASESATTAPPTLKLTRSPCFTSVRMTMFRSIAPSQST